MWQSDELTHPYSEHLAISFKLRKSSETFRMQIEMRHNFSANKSWISVTCYASAIVTSQCFVNVDVVGKHGGNFNGNIEVWWFKGKWIGKSVDVLQMQRNSFMHHCLVRKLIMHPRKAWIYQISSDSWAPTDFKMNCYRRKFIIYIFSLYRYNKTVNTYHWGS